MPKKCAPVRSCRKKLRGNAKALEQYRAKKLNTVDVPNEIGQSEFNVTPRYDIDVPSTSNSQQEAGTRDRGSSTSNYCEVSTDETITVEGRRIVHLMSFIEAIRKLCDHSPFSCSFADMQMVKYTEKGLNFSIWFKCEMCGQVDRVDSSDDSNCSVNLNTWAVSSSIAAGIGQKQLSIILGGMNIPCFSERTFFKEQEVVYSAWEATAVQLMAEAAEEEKVAAIERGDVDPRDGVPLISVIADGCWSKRSYRTGYSALSGVGAIIGYHTRKVLFIGAKNKYCVICARAANSGGDPKNHVCYKNWEQSSSAMESAIVTEGFMRSEEMYGLRYTTLIGDGDSNVYSSIVAAHPYLQNPVEKIECKNHLLRNFTTKLKSVADMKGIYGVHRQAIKGNILRLRKGIVGAIKYRSSHDQSNVLLKNDILNCPSHVFGDHTICADYFCNKQKEQISDLITSMKECVVWHEIMKVVNSLAEHSKSLIHNVDSNPAEIYNNVIAKFVGGKRTNLIQRQSYAARAHVAVASFNTSGKPLYHLAKTLTNSSPGIHCKIVEERVYKKIQRNKQVRGEGKKICRKKLFTERNTPGYGPNCQQIDATPEVVEQRKELHMNELMRLQTQRDKIEEQTRSQSACKEWVDVRKKLLTASNFGRVCSRRKTTSCKNLVKDICYRGTVTTPSTLYGIKYEDTARDQLALAVGNIRKCGLIISEKHCFLGASPDGLIGEDGLVEIKCPSSCATLTIEEGLEGKKINYWRRNKEQTWVFNKKHMYYYQVQGQLAITNRSYCMFYAWSPRGSKVERIERDSSFWENKMLPALEHFYFQCLLPEILDPRFTRNMPIREDPDFVEPTNRKKKSNENESDKENEGDNNE